MSRGKRPKDDKPLIELGQVQKIPAVTRAARGYLQARTDYAETGVAANDAKQRFVALLKEHGLAGYVCDGRELLLTSTERIKVVDVGVATDELDEGDAPAVEA